MASRTHTPNATARPRVTTTVVAAPLDRDARVARRAAFFDALFEACEQALQQRGPDASDHTVAA